jgi:hypothetical protein
VFTLTVPRAPDGGSAGGDGGRRREA